MQCKRGETITKCLDGLNKMVMVLTVTISLMVTTDGWATKTHKSNTRTQKFYNDHIKNGNNTFFICFQARKKKFGNAIQFYSVEITKTQLLNDQLFSSSDVG